MTTFYDFAPSSSGPFRFSPTLDGVPYNVVVTWNVFGQRYYINVYTTGGDLVASLPIIGSPSGVALSELTWASGTALAMTGAPHGYKIGASIYLTVSGAAPDAFNGVVEALITGPNTFSYPLAGDPGNATVLGAVSYDINLVGGYFSESTMIFRDGSNQFEVSP